jgi:hypothetical protein
MLPPHVLSSLQAPSRAAPVLQSSYSSILADDDSRSVTTSGDVQTLLSSSRGLMFVFLTGIALVVMQQVEHGTRLQCLLIEQGKNRSEERLPAISCPANHVLCFCVFSLTQTQDIQHR